MKYQRPPSFDVNHLTMDAGLYLREDHKSLFRPRYRVWDLRFVAPREHTYLSPGALHSIEHLFAFKLRELLGSSYISCFIFGCQTGMGLITTRRVSKKQLTKALIELIEHTVPLTTKTDIPALTEKECGNSGLYNIEATNLWLNIYKQVLCKSLS